MPLQLVSLNLVRCMWKLFWFSKLKIFTLSKCNLIAPVKINRTYVFSSLHMQWTHLHFIPNTEIFIKHFYCFLHHHLQFSQLYLVTDWPDLRIGAWEMMCWNLYSFNDFFLMQAAIHISFTTFYLLLLLPLFNS